MIVRHQNRFAFAVVLLTFVKLQNQIFTMIKMEKELKELRVLYGCNVTIVNNLLALTIVLYVALDS